MNVEAQRISPAPIRKSLRVRAGQRKAFDTFAGAMGSWWLKTHSLVESGQKDVVIEPRAGGRWYEIGNDGSEKQWGRVLAWEAPVRVLLAWQLNAEWTYDPDFETIVEVRFTTDGDDHTIVDFEHRGLEAFGERAEAVRGDYDTGMDGGWQQLLENYRTAAEA